MPWHLERHQDKGTVILTPQIMISTKSNSVNRLRNSIYLVMLTLFPAFAMAQDPLTITPEGNVNIGAKRTSYVSVPGDLRVGGVLDLGYYQQGREANAGKIGYGTFDTAALCIVGAGRIQKTRQIMFWNEGGAKFFGPVSLLGNVGVNAERRQYALDVNGNIGLTGTHLIFDSNDGVINWGKGSLYLRRLERQGDISVFKEIALFTGDGNLALGSTSPYAKLDVNGNIYTTVHGDENEHDAANRGSRRIGMMPANNADFNGMELETRKYDCGNGGIVKFYTWGCNTAYSREVMRIDERGWVGIGTNTPQAPLHVSQMTNRGLKAFYFMFQRESRHVANDNDVHNNSISILTGGGVESLSFYAMSDARIKKEIRLSDKLTDLEKLNRIEIVDYKYRDTVENGVRSQKGVIAQQVEKVFPSIVTKRSDYVPDIYALADEADVKDNQLTLVLKNAHQLSTGDSVRLISETDGVKEVAVKVLNNKTFTVDNWTAAKGGIFVYGKKVNDFRAVDYQQIFSTGISAIQQLSKETAALKDENAKLKAQVSELERTIQLKIKSLEDKMAVRNRLPVLEKTR